LQASVHDRSPRNQQLHAQHQTPAPHLPHQRRVPLGHRGERFEQVGALPAAVLQQSLLQQRLERGQTGGRGQRVSAEGGRMAARNESGSQFLPGHQGADRDAAGQTLGQGHQIRHGPDLLIGEQRARAPHPHLDLVVDQQQFPLVAQPAHPRQIVFRGQIDSAFPLDRLHQDRAGLLAQRLLKRRKIVEGHVAEAGHQGIESLAELLLAGGGDRGQGPAVKGIEHGENLVTAAPAHRTLVAAHELDGRLVGLGAAVAEKHPGAERQLRDLPRQLRLPRNVIQVGDVQQTAGLLADGLHHARVAVAEVADRQAGDEIQIAPAVRIPQPAPPAPHKGHRKPAVGLHHIAAGHGHDPLVALRKGDFFHLRTRLLLLHMSRHLCSCTFLSFSRGGRSVQACSASGARRLRMALFPGRSSIRPSMIRA